MDTEFLHGTPLFVDYTPSGAAVAAGAVVVVGSVPFVCHGRIEDGVKGALAARGGVYQCVADGNLTPGAKVYWNDTTNKITVTAAAGANKHFGFILPQSDPAADLDPVLVIHAPDGTSV
jgi:predicted RecA/RadA family phage recombinase